MAINRAPATWWPSWSEDGTTISVPIASFPEMTAAEADGTTGDICNVLYAMLHKTYAKYVSLATADKPTTMGVYKNVAENATTGKQTVTFTVQFVTSIAAGSQNVDAET